MIKLTLTHKVRAMHAKEASKIRKPCCSAAGRLTTAGLGWQLGVNTAESPPGCLFFWPAEIASKIGLE